METTSQLSSFDTMASPDSHSFLKLEDLDSSLPSGTVSFENNGTSDSSTPHYITVHSKQAKKRKSWGQALPEPSTNLPPRKRAKTDDEKEQRRIERIKRNRAAAHNSRERKRQETETLAVALARANAELDAYKSLHGPLPASVVLPEVTLSTDRYAESLCFVFKFLTLTLHSDTPAPSLIESHGSVDAASPASPLADSLYDYPVNIKQEPIDADFPVTIPPAFTKLDAKPSSLPTLDQTQHSAAMLCDLQCRSSLGSRNTASTQSTSWWTNLFLYLMTLQLQIGYKAILLSIWTNSPSRMARLMQASTLRLTSRSMTSSTTPQPSRSTMVLAQRNAATAMAPRQSALALQRLSLNEVQRRRVMASARRQHHSGTDTKALEDQDKIDGFGGEESDGGIGS